MRNVASLGLVLALSLTACSDGTGPEPSRLESELEFVRFPTTPPVETLEASFWAVKGENRELEIRYLSEEPGEQGGVFLEFRVPGGGLLRRPDGSLFQPGDSVRITVTLSGDGRCLFTLQPAGLVFDPDRPARLRVRYDRIGYDLNGDGRIDDADRRLDERMRVWKQEQAGQPWVQIGTVRIKGSWEIEGRIDSFTGFAIAG